MTARERFNLNDRVKLTDEAVRQMGKPRSRYGTVTGFSHKPHMVRVLIDGNRWAPTYHESYWEVAE